MGTGHRDTGELKAGGVTHEFYKSGGERTWLNWREYLALTAPRLFRRAAGFGGGDDVNQVWPQRIYVPSPGLGVAHRMDAKQNEPRPFDWQPPLSGNLLKSIFWRIDG